MDTPQGITIDISKYLEQKETKAVSVVKLNGVVYYSKKAYNPDTGIPTSVLVPIEAAVIQAQLDSVRQQVAIFTAILADIETAVEIFPQTPEALAALQANAAEKAEVISKIATAIAITG